MKNLRLFLIALLCVTTVTAADAQFTNRVSGNGNVQKEERKASPFTGIKTSAGIDVFLSQGNGHSIVVEADENLIEYIRTEIDNDILKIYPDNINFRGTRTMRVYVTMEDVEYLSTSSAGDIIGETAVRSENLKITTSSSGDVKVEVYAGELVLRTSSAGDITLKGTADYVDAKTSSAGDIKAYDLEAREADLRASSAGDIKITVTEKMTARASSAGDIHYRGNPQYVNSRSSSGGDVQKK